ncbi:MAG: hypothetical protein AAFP19_02040 [Bacteroidota bacterium]
MTILIDALGWLGAIGILLAYYWSSNQKFDDSFKSVLQYQAMNILGAVGLLINSFYYGAVPSVIVNAIWVGIAFYALKNTNRAKSVALS